MMIVFWLMTTMCYIERLKCNWNDVASGADEETTMSDKRARQCYSFKSALTLVTSSHSPLQ